MTRNDGVYLQDCLNSILKNTVYPFNLYVIDNNSSDKLHLKILEEYKTRQNVTVIRNKSNLWVLGLNKHLEKVKRKVVLLILYLLTVILFFLSLD
ncbi:glycosyltransferase family 2 protein [Escherichia coli]